MSVTRNGRLTGLSLAELVQRYGPSLIGPAAAQASRWEGGFPLLIKIIDARARLSVQVHPDEAGTARAGGEPKTEAWLSLDMTPGARVFSGLRAGVTRADLERAIRDDVLEPMLRSVPLRPGQAVFVPGGRVHAIGEGCLLLEAQQNSNTTYRVYDWGRVGKDGRPRPLHIREALDVVRWDDAPEGAVEPTLIESRGANRLHDVIQCAFFGMQRSDLREPESLAGDGRPVVLFVISGTVAVSGNGIEEPLTPGTSCLVPAALPDCRLEPIGGPASVVQIRHNS
jgi:mannose-6-phosphate isomerase